MKRIAMIACLLLAGCDETGKSNHPQSDSGVTKATVKVQTDTAGHTTEQNNIIERYRRDNLPGSIKYLYVISAYSGDVLLFSSVKGKATSSGKRLTPMTVQVGDGNQAHRFYGFEVLNGHETSEVLQDDGTYGSSIEYLYWFDQRGVYHQHYVTGGEIVHISDQPLVVPKIIINLETAK